MNYSERLFARWLIGILRAIKKQLDAIAKYLEFYPSAKKSEKLAIGPVEVLFPRDALDRHYAELDKSYRLQRSTFYVGVLTLIALAAYTFVTYRQWRAMLASNEINRESLQSVQRALVGFVNYTIEPYERHEESASEKYWAIHGTWENFGATPAIGAVQYIGVDDLPSEPNDDQFRGSSQNDDHPVPIVVVPHGLQDSARVLKPDSFIRFPRNVPIDKIQTVNFTGHRFFWGWIVYRDVFRGTKPRVTEVCRRLTEVQLKIAVGSKQPMTYYTFSPCEQHNCVDEYCPDYRTIAAMTPQPSPN